jgi:hypothetical protein
LGRETPPGGLQNPAKAGVEKGWTWGAPWPCTLMCTLTKKSDQLEVAADQAIEACGGDAREAVKALIVANQFLETDLEKLRAAVSPGYARGQLQGLVCMIELWRGGSSRIAARPTSDDFLIHMLRALAAPYAIPFAQR